MEQLFIYLDDVRTPKEHHWIVVRDLIEFVKKIDEIGLENISVISLDHDLGPTATKEYFNNVSPNYILDYANIKEHTGMDCAKWLVAEFYRRNPAWITLPREDKKDADVQFPFPKVFIHSANPIGSANIMGYINNFLMNEAQPQSCSRVHIEHTIIKR